MTDAAPSQGKIKNRRLLVRNLRLSFLILASRADKVITRSTLPGCRAKEKADQRIMLPVKNQILHVLSHRAIETQIMIQGKQTLEEPQIPGLRVLKAQAIEAVLCGT